jgi:hypothetical protein
MLDARRLPEDLEREIDEVQEQARRMARGGPEARLTDAEVERANALSRRVIETFTQVDSEGNPINEIDRAILSALAAREEEISAEIKALNTEGDPEPLDYYEIYHRVLRDSGFMASSLPEPSSLRELIEQTGGAEATMRQGAAKLAASCDACANCQACTLCTACSLCQPAFPAAAVAGTNGTGLTAGAVGFISIP